MPSRFVWRRRLKLLQAKIVVGMICPSELRDAAMEALHDQCDGDALVALATLESPYDYPGNDAVEIFWRVAKEQRLRAMNSAEALLRFAVHTCRQLIAGANSTDECAFQIFEARLRADRGDELQDMARHGCGDPDGLAFLSFMDRSDFSCDPPKFDRLVMEIATRWASAGPLGPRC